MDIFLHLGAHRTATKSFHNYLRGHQAELAERGVAFWAGGDARSGTTEECLNAAQNTGMKHFVISDADALGPLEVNVRTGQLYPEARSRVARLLRGLNAPVRQVLLSVRSLETYWCSALACGVAQGLAVPERGSLMQLAAHPRGWRDVTRDIAGAAPGATLRVLPFERYRARADSFLSDALDIAAPFDTARSRSNPTPTLPDLRRALHEHGTPGARLPFGMGRWNPFSNDEHAQLRARHAQDMTWLAAGADGLATLTEDRFHERAGPTLPHGAQCKGQFDELEERQVARPG